MFREIQMVLDPPPLGFYTYEDPVSGKLIYESPRDESVRWVIVFFHCWAKTQVEVDTRNVNAGGNGYSVADKEVVFQLEEKAYPAQEEHGL